ncbi:hypothetical protein [Lysobacter antibioticus]|uniref:hypothetical protein n=1 Tax=Lysobacter antibioticus TaxID=84531 RepID=UPI00034D883B|nr:hypothetical protein [Lysobacter antibioticus]
MSRLTADYFLSQADAAAAQRADTYEYVQPSESLAKSAALAEAQREAAELAAEVAA